jgi:hypothetical protein
LALRLRWDLLDRSPLTRGVRCNARMLHISCQLVKRPFTILAPFLSQLAKLSARGTGLSCLTGRRGDDVHQLTDPVSLDRVPGDPIDLEAGADDGAVRELEQFGRVGCAKPGVDQDRHA